MIVSIRSYTENRHIQIRVSAQQFSVKIPLALYLIRRATKMITSEGGKLNVRENMLDIV